MARQMKDSGVEWIGEIPEEWKCTKYKYFTTNRMGETILAEQTVAEGIPIYSATQEDKVFGYAESPNLVLRRGDFVIPARGNSIGCITVIKDDLATCTQTTICSRNIRNINSKFLYFCGIGLKDNWFKYEGSAIPQITVDQIKNNILPLPPAAEQQKIADFLDEKVGEIDSVIAKTKETIEDYKKYRQAIITDAVTKGLNPNVEMKESKTSYFGLIPAHWNEKRLRFLGMCQNGISKSSEYFGEGYPFVSYGDVYKNYTLPEMGSGLIKSSEEDRNIYSVQYGDVFFTRTSETIEEVGFASTCLKSIDNATFAGFVIRFRPNNQEELLPEFSKYYFRSDAHRKFFVKEMNLVTRASLSQELLKKLPVLLPPLEEQREIAEYLDEKRSEIDKLIVKKEELLADLEDYKKSLIYEYVTGKKEVE